MIVFSGPSDILECYNSPYVRFATLHELAREELKNTVETEEFVNSSYKNEIIEYISNKTLNFKVINIETKTRCNFTCNFCPVNLNVDPRPIGEMDWKIIYKIADELSDINYSKTINLFGNNEPLLDNRITKIIDIFRKACPNSKIKLLTNGILLNKKLCHDLFESGLSKIRINNYGNKLISSCKEILSSAQEFRNNDIVISVRLRSEILTTRAGNAPNKHTAEIRSSGFCGLPFVDLTIDYLGRAVLCCFDAYSEHFIADISRVTLREAWMSSTLRGIRDTLSAEGRQALPVCSKCDFDGFRDFEQNPSHPRRRPHSNDMSQRPQQFSTWK